MRERLAEYGARLIFATRAVDKGYHLFDRVRSKLTLAISSEAVLDRFNDLSYGSTNTYRPDSAAFRKNLFFWEQDAIEQFFPPPPARVLVGGAGGGREAFALAKKGYQVVAFDPSTSLVKAMAAGVTDGMCVEVLVGSYADMPRLFLEHLRSGSANPPETRPFGAAILGWWSFAHLTNETQRVQALRDFGRLTNGPIVVSFSYMAGEPGESARPGRLDSLLRRGLNKESGNVFSTSIGYYHQFDVPEIARLVRLANLRMISLNTNGIYGYWPHAILIPSDICMD